MIVQEKSMRKNGPVDTSHSPYARRRTLPFDAVRLTGGFWAERQSLNRKVSLRHGYEMLEKAGNFQNLRIAAGLARGEFRGRNFYDEDVYKWLEALGWELGHDPDAELQRMADEVIVLLAAAQRPDGYLDSYYQVAEPDKRWANLDHSHELYCAGHLFQAAVAFQRATGDGRLMEIACRFADHICSTFGPGKRADACGHPEVEMALVELYRQTGRSRYLEMSQFFIDQRGKGKMSGWASYGPEYHQDHVPVRQAQEAAGHAVRQVYLTTGVTDLYLETGEQALLDAMNRLWHDVEETKLFITGGVGSRYDGESFGDPYELPPDQCYCETCAAIGNLMWNWRLLLVTGDSRYADLIEQSLYNGILSSPALDGRHYFYVNPLMIQGGKYTRLSSNPPKGEIFSGRPAWHYVACCPPNVMRLFASLTHYFATTDEKGIQIHLYGAADIACELRTGERVALQMATEYPWQGQIRLEIKETGSGPWQLGLRRPGWSQEISLSLNGKKIAPLVEEEGYLILERSWQTGDTVVLNFDMPPVLVESNPRVDATRGCVAIQRGPIVYCLESHDQAERENLLDVQIDTHQPLQLVQRDDLLGGVMTVETAGYVADNTPWQGALYRAVGQVPTVARRSVRLVAIPYYAWGNRGIESMRVWIPKG